PNSKLGHQNGIIGGDLHGPGNGHVVVLTALQNDGDTTSANLYAVDEDNGAVPGGQKAKTFRVARVNLGQRYKILSPRTRWRYLLHEMLAPCQGRYVGTFKTPKESNWLVGRDKGSGQVSPGSIDELVGLPLMQADRIRSVLGMATCRHCWRNPHSCSVFRGNHSKETTLRVGWRRDRICINHANVISTQEVSRESHKPAGRVLG